MFPGETLAFADLRANALFNQKQGHQKTDGQQDRRNKKTIRSPTWSAETAQQRTADHPANLRRDSVLSAQPRSRGTEATSAMALGI